MEIDEIYKKSRALARMGGFEDGITRHAIYHLAHLHQDLGRSDDPPPLNYLSISKDFLIIIPEIIRINMNDPIKKIEL